MAGPSSTGNFAQAAIATARDNEKILKSTLENSPNYSKIVQEAAVRRGKENIAAMRAESKVSQAAVSEYGKTKTKKGIMDAEDGYRKEKRKAGVLASAGGLLGTGIGGLGQKPREKREVGEYDSYYEKQIKSARDSLSESEQAIMDFNKPKPATAAGGGTADSGGSTKGVSSSISAQHAAGPGALSKAQIKKYALDAGFSEQDASTVVGIAGGESGYDPTNSTKRSGLYAQTGEDSVGLMQINWGYHKDSGWLQGLGITSREQLLDPATNMKAAKYLHSGRGNFGDWTVYNKEIYKDYL